MASADGAGSDTVVASADFAGLELEAGRLASLTVAYETYGRLNEHGDNAILVCHALSGSAHAGNLYDGRGKLIGASGWWEALIGPGRAFDTERYCVVCSNILGSCYGTTGPTSIDPSRGAPYGAAFPPITVRDMVRAQKLLLDRLGVRRLVTVTGGSLGGFQVVEWAAMFPEMVASVVPIATSLAHSPWCVAFNQVAREAIRLDPAWDGGGYPPDAGPAEGLNLARQIAMISYRSDISFAVRFARRLTPGAARPDPIEWRFEGNAAPPGGDDFEVSRYLYYQGRKLVERFDANTYITITEAMDRHDVASGRGSAAEALAPFRGPALCLGIDSDVLYPAHEQQAIAALLARNGNASRYAEIHSPHGHDAFLIENDALTALITPFVEAVA